MSDADILDLQGLALFGAGRWDDGAVLFEEALDENPLHHNALENLGRVAVRAPAWGDELLTRARAAFAAATTRRERRERRWFFLTHAAWHNRLDAVAAIADAPDILDDNESRRAAVGGLLLELGRACDGEALLEATPIPLSVYHCARLAERSGNALEARALLALMPADGDDGILRAIGDAGVALGAGDANPATALLASPGLQARRAPPHLTSEMLVLSTRLALARGERAAAREAVAWLGYAPHTHDPSAMLRMAALFGPLPLLGQS